MARFTDEALKGNERYASGFGGGGLGRQPARRLAVVACMDARIDVHRILGLEEGDAHLIRNAGGVVTDAEIRALAISQRKMGTEEVVLIAHTDCGMLGFDDAAFRRQLEQETGVRPNWPGDALQDLEQHLREAIARIGSSPFIPHTDSVRGFVYEVESGRLREVKA